MTDIPAPKLNLSDIQGFVLRGYHMKTVRHFVLRIKDAAAAKRLLAKSVDQTADFPSVTSAAPWSSGKPAYCLNIGIAFSGLKRLMDTSGVNFPGDNLADFHRNAYLAGAAAAANWNGDTGESAPANWQGGLGTEDAHVIFSLFAMEVCEIEKQAAALKKAFADEKAFDVLHIFEGNAIPGDKVHFGYKDGIAQPQISGGSGKKLADDQLEVQSWQFVLQDVDPNIPGNADCTYLSAIKTEKQKALLLDGSFAAFRVLEQDVVAFDKYLNDNADKIAPEMLAAKMCGRWRDGNPLVLDPNNQTDVPADQLNKFEYRKADRHGERCPFSSHIRRSNPRNERIRGSADGTGKGVRNHRIVRRGMPYGPEYKPGKPDDGVKRGLLGMFICADLANQFEFIMNDWVNASNFASGTPRGKEPLLGANDASSSLFRVPGEDGATLELQGFPRFIQTRGGAYLFLPSLSALKYIADAETP